MAFHREVCNAGSMESGQRIGQDEDGPRPIPGHYLERTFELLGTARLKDLKLDG
jgi:hypothetical protein